MEPGREQSTQGNTDVPRARFQIPERVPVFALPNVVLFPKTYLPLHIFEPRYRAMVADAQAGGRCIAMTLLKEGWESEYHGNPPIFSIGCVGRLAKVQPLADGRFNILLQGLERYEVREEFSDKPYREARIEIKPLREAGALDTALRDRLLGLLHEYAGTVAVEAAALELFARQSVADDLLIHSLSGSLDCTPLEKQFLLEAETLSQQTRRLCDLIQFKLLERRGTKGWG